jgi:hypothetical protein
MIVQVRAWISFGMGGQSFDPASGETYLVARLKAIGVDTRNSPYQWSDIYTIIDDVKKTPKGIKVAIGGDSLGANEAPAIAVGVGNFPIDYLFGFQRSEYGEQVAVPKNVLVAESIYNPIWIETLGLGDDPWSLADGNTTTKLTNTPMTVVHPDDWGDAQDIVYKAIKELQGA